MLNIVTTRGAERSGVATLGKVRELEHLAAVRELEHKLRDSGARLLVSLTQAPFAQRTVELLAAGVLPRAVLADDAAWGGNGGPVPADDRVLSWEALVEGVDATPPDVPVTPQDPALLQYTGGTTGLPKAAVLTHEALAAAAQLYRYAWEHDPERVEEGERGLSISPLFDTLHEIRLNPGFPNGESLMAAAALPRTPYGGLVYDSQGNVTYNSSELGLLLGSTMLTHDAAVAAGLTSTLSLALPMTYGHVGGEVAIQEVVSCHQGWGGERCNVRACLPSWACAAGIQMS